MSQYIHLFLSDGIHFFPLVEYSRSTLAYDFLQNYTEYGKVCPFKRESIRSVVRELEVYIVENEANEGKILKHMDWLAGALGTISEKLELLREHEVCLKELREAKDEAKSLLSFLRTLDDAADTAAWLRGEGKRFGYLPEQYIYIGLECGIPEFKNGEVTYPDCE